MNPFLYKCSVLFAGIIFCLFLVDCYGFVLMASNIVLEASSIQSNDKFFKQNRGSVPSNDGKQVASK